MDQSELRNPHPQILIIGVGNEYRSDDGVGLIVARRLREVVSDDVVIIEHTGEGASLIEILRDAGGGIIVDALHSGAKPGTIFRLDATEQPIPTGFFHYSSHAFNVAEAIELARALNELPANLLIYGIEGEDFEAGQRLSSAVEKACTEVVERILREIDTSAKPAAAPQSGS